MFMRVKANYVSVQMSIFAACAEIIDLDHNHSALCICTMFAQPTAYGIDPARGQYS